MSLPDTRIAYGARCSWWDNVQNAGTRDINGRRPGEIHGLPCCPHPDYVAFIRWLRGRCYPGAGAARAAFNAEHAEAGDGS